MLTCEELDQELSSIDLGDKRLNVRAESIYKGFSSNPSSSINATFGAWGDVKAAYNFFSNAKVTDEKLLAPHFENTLRRMYLQDVILCIQDTTTFEYSHRGQVSGLGNIRTEFDQGFLMHPTIAVTPEGLSLGMINNYNWVRENFKGKDLRREIKPIEEKESMRWIDSYRQTDKLAHACPNSLLINITDREGDFYELLQEYEEGKSKAHLIVRAKSDRVLSKLDKEEEVGSKLWSSLSKQEATSSITFEMGSIDGSGSKKRRSTKPSRKKRTVTQEIRVKRVKFDPPRKVRKLNKLGPIEVTAILCREVNPPAGEKAIEWLLLTSLKLDQEVTAKTILSYYLCRWQIELFFKTLKSGCKIEELQFDNYERIKQCITMYCIVAWRILYISWVGRVYPEYPCTAVFTESEWKSAYIVSKKEKPPQKPITIKEIILIIAQFGGFLKRKSDKEPGIKSIWIGMQRLRDFSLAYELVNNIV